jgi:hypothetical protein
MFGRMNNCTAVISGHVIECYLFWRLAFFYPVPDFTQPENGLPTPPLPFPYTGCHQTASYSPKMAPLHFCTSGSEMPLTEEPGLTFYVSTTNTLSGALCLRPLPSASGASSLDCYRPYHPRPLYLLVVLPLPSSPAAVAGRCVTR